jgi:hypothetical protein
MEDRVYALEVARRDVAQVDVDRLDHVGRRGEVAAVEVAVVEPTTSSPAARASGTSSTPTYPL